MDRKLRILEVNKFYFPHIGGIETVIEQRAAYFSGLADVEAKVLVCQEKGKGCTETIDGTEITRAGSLGTYFSCPLSFEFLWKFRKMAKWADVIEFHTPFPLGDLALLLSGYRGRVVIAWHSDVIKQKKLLRFYKPILHRFLKRADAIITATQGHIDSSSFLPEFREKCHIIPYGLDEKPYRSAEVFPILTRQCGNFGFVKFLFVGRLVYYKGVDVLLDAFRKVRGCELFICGTGPLEEELKAKAADLPVHFLGRLTDEELKSAFADCDVFVLPSVENSEAFGIVQQEAMVYGKPVINTSIPTGVPYVSIHGETGLTVPPRDVDALAQAITTLAKDVPLRRKYGVNARKRVLTEYDYQKNMEKILAVLRPAEFASDENEV